MTLQEFINKWDCIPLIGFEGGYGTMLKGIEWLGYCCYDESTGPNYYRLEYSNHVDITCGDPHEIDDYLNLLDSYMPNIIRANWPTDESNYNSDHAIQISLDIISRQQYDIQVVNEIKNSINKYSRDREVYYEILGDYAIKLLESEQYETIIDNKYHRSYIKKLV